MISTFSAPSATPANLLQSASTTDTISITWGEVPCGSRGGEILQYRYQLKQNADLITHGMTSNMSVVIGGLEPCMTYSFSVSAVNSAGKGPDGILRVMTQQFGK